MAEILYRKWRPRSFSELAGQEHVATTLVNALSSGRVAHAYLFAGPRGTGKTTTGRLLGKALNCTDRRNGEPCNACESCQSFLAGRAMDLIELDAASNRGIDEIRSLRDKVAFAPGAGAYKVYLIDEVHMLTEAAFNALLKTLEEPPPHAVFILATTEAHKLPATIASRCQRFDFRRIPVSATVHRLRQVCAGEGISCEPAALELIARTATGSLRDANNILDQLATSYGKDLTLEHVRTGLGLIGDERAGELARVALAGDLGAGLSLIASVRDDGLDLRQFQRELVEELRGLLMVKSGLDPEDGVTAERRAEMQSTVNDVPPARLVAALRAFGEADLKNDPSSTLPLDIALAACVMGADGDVRMRTETAQPAGQSGLPTGQAGNRAIAQGATDPSPPRSPRTPSSRDSASLEPTTEAASREADRKHTPLSTVNGEAGAPAPAASGSLAEAQAQMRAIYERARTVRFQLGALLNSPCDIIEAGDARIVFGFKHAPLLQRATDAANLSALRQVVSEVLGRPVEVICRQDDGVESWQHREPVSRSPLVRAAQEMGARVLSSGPEEIT